MLFETLLDPLYCALMGIAIRTEGLQDQLYEASITHFPETRPLHAVYVDFIQKGVSV